MKEVKKQRMELLSPAGSMETLKAVTVAGADAVYAAGGKFGARAYANNFTEEELLYAIDYLHLHDKRLYLTVNTLLKEDELEQELYNYIKPLYQQGLDGVIIQDFGVLRFLRTYFPDMELHASTQMSITGVNGAKLMKEAGCNRIVTARELSLGEIKKIHDEVDIEIESFIHGALCYCYSGQCLFSSMLGGRSGNRGRCAQPCRLPYQVKNANNSYLLSPKDLCTIELLPQIMESGVYSLKIEGRMKQAEYAAGVTSIYREYLDRCLKYPLEEYKVSDKDIKRLEDLGNRSGFTKGYYVQKNGPAMMAMGKPAHTKSNDSLQEEMRQRFLNQEIQEKMKGNLILSKENPAKLVLKCKEEEIEIVGDMVQQAKSRPMDRATIEEKMKKTGGSNFYFENLEIQMEDDIFIPVGALNQLRRDGIQRLQDNLLKNYRRDNDRQQKYMEQNYIIKNSKPVFQEAIIENDSHVIKDKFLETKKSTAPYLAVALQTTEQVQQVLKYPYVDKIYIDSGAFAREQECYQLQQLCNQVQEAGKELYYMMPAVLRNNTIDWYQENIPNIIKCGINGFVVGNYESFKFIKEAICHGEVYSEKVGKSISELSSEKAGEIAAELYSDKAEEIDVEVYSDKAEEIVSEAYSENASEAAREMFSGKTIKIVTDSSLYVWSSQASQAFLEAGANEITLPLEANERELKNRPYKGGELIVYGYLPLMVSAQCVVNNATGCKKKTGITMMTDRYGKNFMVKNQCKDCYNIIYNTSPLSLLHQQRGISQMEVNGYRISFTKENKEQIKEIMAYYEQAFIRKEKIHMEKYLKDFTNGHFKRGVE